MDEEEDSSDPKRQQRGPIHLSWTDSPEVTVGQRPVSECDMEMKKTPLYRVVPRKTTADRQSDHHEGTSLCRSWSPREAAHRGNAVDEVDRHRSLAAQYDRLRAAQSTNAVAQRRHRPRLRLPQTEP